MFPKGRLTHPPGNLSSAFYASVISIILVFILFSLFFVEEARNMVDPAKTPAKSAAQLRKESQLAKKAAAEAKKGGVRSSIYFVLHLSKFL